MVRSRGPALLTLQRPIPAASGTEQRWAPRVRWEMARSAWSEKLACVELDDELLGDLRIDVAAVRQAVHAGRRRSAVPGEPGGNLTLAGRLDAGADDFQVARGVLDGDDVARLHQRRGDVQLPAVKREVA